MINQVIRRETTIQIREYVEVNDETGSVSGPLVDAWVVEQTTYDRPSVPALTGTDPVALVGQLLGAP